MCYNSINNYDHMGEVSQRMFVQIWALLIMNYHHRHEFENIYQICRYVNVLSDVS